MATIAANFWPRRFEEWRYPVEAALFNTEKDVRILVHVQRPRRERPKGEVVLVHGLEGSSNSVYMRSLAQTLLDDGWTVHRTNIRRKMQLSSVAALVNLVLRYKPDWRA